MSLSLLNPAFQAAVDTVIAVAPRDPLSTAVDLATLLMALGVMTMAFLFALVMRRVDRGLRDLRRSLDRHMGPVSDRARSISDNVEFITDALRADVQRLNASVKALSDRLHQASDRMEERVEEFNALMEVVQSEAEDIFLDTAATVRGVREGARTMASGERGERTGEPIPRRRPGAEVAGAPPVPGEPPHGRESEEDAGVVPGGDDEDEDGSATPAEPSSSPTGTR